jgi:hypothetical protein
VKVRLKRVEHPDVPLPSFHPEMALFRNLGVTLRNYLCDIHINGEAAPFDPTLMAGSPFASDMLSK